MPNPPKLAVWLFDRFGVSHSNSPLYGDIIEEFHAGRSSGWFWKQTLVAIARNGRFMPGFAFATLVGWAIQLVPAFLILRVTQHLDFTLRILAVAFGLALFAVQNGGRHLLIGNKEWREMQCTLQGDDAPFSYRGVPLWVLIALDECADYLVTYIWMVASIGPFTFKTFVYFELSWLIAHAVVQRRFLRRTRT